MPIPDGTALAATAPARVGTFVGLLSRLSSFLRTNGWRALLMAMLLTGILLLALNVLSLPQRRSAILAVSMLLAGGFALLGGLLGFLFAIPRSFSGGKIIAATEAQADEARRRYDANTNLEEISDWLTKILVGVGLTQIVQMPELLAAAGDRLGPALDDGQGHGAHMAVAIILYFTPLGFLFGYLWTRIFAAMHFTHGERLQGQIQEMRSKVAALEAQPECDARALGLVRAFLNPRARERAFSLAELSAAVTGASPDTRIEICFQAADVRKEAEAAGNGWLVERTAMIFEALLKAPPESNPFSLHAQLGMALISKDPPDYEAAQAQLDQAITKRGPWQIAGRLNYEYYRAICRINLDHNLATGRAADEPTRLAVLGDLAAARNNAEMLDSLRRRFPVVGRWLAINGLNEDLTPAVH